MAGTKPTSVTIRAYDVGFGDCFLLSFKYAASTKHVLIDFGSHPGAKRKTAGTKINVARHIAKTCDNNLTALVATHRHADHINGFATNANGTGPGDIIRACKPKRVIQPWTENPSLAAESKGPKGIAGAQRQRVAAIRGVVDFYAGVQKILKTAPASWSKFARRELSAKSELGTHTLNAMSSLTAMAPKSARKYVHFGAATGLGSLLPGVKVRVLGPPTIAQAATIEAQVQEHDEFWKIMGATARTFAPGRGGGFSARYRGSPPAHVRWLIKHADDLTKDQLLAVVRRMDDYLNNTSVILLFEVGSKKLLFPGDAQIENWSYAMSKPAVAKLLADVDLYKVGHHGSRNATPKHTLWEKFSKRKRASGRLITMMSTESGHHGTTAVTAVPSGSLVDALETESEYLSTSQASKLVKIDNIAYVEKTIPV